LDTCALRVSVADVVKAEAILLRVAKLYAEGLVEEQDSVCLATATDDGSRTARAAALAKLEKDFTAAMGKNGVLTLPLEQDTVGVWEDTLRALRSAANVGECAGGNIPRLTCMPPRLTCSMACWIALLHACRLVSRRTTHY
jgi:hypothetical protein